MEEIITLIERARTGDSEAYGILVSRFQDMAYGYAYAILNDFCLAQDAAQEAFIEAYQCLPTLREALAFPAWLKRIVRKHCDRLIRGKRLSTAPLDAATEVASPQPGPAEVAERRELAQRVRDAIRDLPDQQRVVTTLFYINGYSHQDIADFLEVPAKTVKSRLHASRSRLRERMIDMVEDELKANKLPEEFAKETVEQAVARARELNRDSKFDEAEQLLRQVLEQVPQHPVLLTELNRTLMWGQVYTQGRWDILPELAKRGREILQNADDEHVLHELARTLLAIPAMPEAVGFIQEWIELRGPNLERLGMLAWAKGCVADYEAADELWGEFLTLSQDAEGDNVLFHVPFVAYTLVDCFAEAGELPRAQRVAKQAWERCSDLGPTSPELATALRKHRGFAAEAGWLLTYHRAKLDLRDIAQVLLSRCLADESPRSRGTALSIRGWVDEPQAVLADWLEWARERISAGDYGLLETFRTSCANGLRARGEWRVADRLAHGVWELLRQEDGEEAAKHCLYWSWGLSSPIDAVRAGDLEAAEEMARLQIQERGLREGGWSAIMVATARGEPTPTDVWQAICESGVDSVDGYGMEGSYAVAREAAAAGDQAKAFDALRKALSYWSNPPLSLSMKLWEQDVRWGDLRNHPEFKAAFDERRRRIGPVYGQIHYFPGW